MEESSVVHLDLRAPLDYAEAPGLTPFASPPLGGHLPVDGPERLFCFALDREQAGRIDPEADRFLGEMAFAGAGDGTRGKIRLPAGRYLFVQQRRALNREECVSMAIEQHKDGLWERLCLEERLYVRCLFEDGSPVTQLFRPYREE